MENLIITNGLELINGKPDYYEWLSDYPQMDIPRPARPFDDRYYYAFTGKNNNSVLTVTHCPYGQPGDVLWVREKLYQEGELGLKYVANNKYIDESIIPKVPFKNGSYRNYAFCNVPNIHMPKWACRIFLQIKSIRVERLQDISYKDALNEGVDWKQCPTYQTEEQMERMIKGNGCSRTIDYQGGFKILWQSINGPESWNGNPWVWVVEFEKTEKPLNF